MEERRLGPVVRAWFSGGLWKALRTRPFTVAAAGDRLGAHE
jgi:Na+-transporting NADH:ubiquinone oxidoreductase subunit NqrA